MSGSLPASCEVAVIGAGAAGLGAATALRARGVDTVVLEAKDRIGGRAYTESATLGIPFDHGCHWLHSASRNPFVGLAGELGLAVGPDERPRRIWLGRRWADAAEVAAWRDHVTAAYSAMEDAAGRGEDVAVAEVVPSAARWSALFDAWLGMINGVNGDAASTLDHATYVDTEENWSVAGGYGALIARLGAGLSVQLNAPVRRVDWRDAALRIDTPRGTISASALVVTVSTAVLASGSIQFHPPLPAWKRDAAGALPMGAANKVAFRFERDVFGLPEESYAAFSNDRAEAFNFQIRSFGAPVATGYVGGRFCDALEAAGTAAMKDAALAQLKAIFGSGIGEHVTASAATAWRGDSDIGGAYSAARPGQAARRSDLARPVDGRLFFAGEATSIDFYSTAHGAYLSGLTAASAVAEAIAAS